MPPGVKYSVMVDDIIYGGIFPVENLKNHDPPTKLLTGPVTHFERLVEYVSMRMKEICFWCRIIKINMT